MTKIVRGYCPMGCGESLILEGARIKCNDFACSNPEAVHLILDNRETEHIVVIGAHDFTIKHPLRERIEDNLFECPINQALLALPGPPEEPGTYRVYTIGADQLQFERIPDREEPPHA